MPTRGRFCPPSRDHRVYLTPFLPSATMAWRGLVFIRRGIWRESSCSPRQKVFIKKTALSMMRQRKVPPINVSSYIPSLIAGPNGEAINGKSLIRSSILRKQCKKWFTRRSGLKCVTCSPKRKLKEMMKIAENRQMMRCRTFWKIKI